MRAIQRWLPVALGVVFLLALAWIQRERALTGANDFAQLYAGGKLAGTPDLYSRPANLEAIRSALGFTMETVVYTRPPFYARLLAPLAALPYRVAYLLFTLVTFGCAVWFVIRFSRECPTLPVFAAMSIPLMSALCGGQDTPLLVAMIGGAMLLARWRRDSWAGVLLSLVAIKFHLFLFLPLLLVMKRRWRMLGGAAAGTAVLTLVGGSDALGCYIAVLRDPWINPTANIMPNLHGLAAVLNGGPVLEGALIVAVLAAFAWMSRRTDDFELLLGVALVCGLLVSFHSGIMDDVLLLPVFVAVVRGSTFAPLRAGAGLLLTPIPYFLVLAGAPYSAAMPVALLVLLGLFCVSVRRPAAYSR